MEQLSNLLQQLGLSDKEATIYLTLLRTGGATVRAIAQASGINRGTAFDCLKALRSKGLVAYYHKAAHQHFVAEPPEKVVELVDESLRERQRLREAAVRAVPALQSLMDTIADKPVVKFYEGERGIRTVLQDVLTTMGAQPERMYLVYSSADIRQYLYESFPTFTEERIKRSIHVRVIAAGSGGELHGLDERKWLPGATGGPTYIILYAHRTALISVTKAKQPIAAVIEDEGIAETQRRIFAALWTALPNAESHTET